jgi:hypothetical protein
MQHFIQSVHITLLYFPIQLQSSIHITHYSPNTQKDLKLNLDRVLRGHLIMIGYLLKIATEPIGNNGGLADWCAQVVPNRGVSNGPSYWSRVVYFGLCSRLIGASVSWLIDENIDHFSRGMIPRTVGLTEMCLSVILDNYVWLYRLDYVSTTIEWRIADWSVVKGIWPIDI